jgi:hypothetical protein
VKLALRPVTYFISFMFSKAIDTLLLVSFSIDLRSFISFTSSLMFSWNRLITNFKTEPYKVSTSLSMASRSYRIYVTLRWRLVVIVWLVSANVLSVCSLKDFRE